MKKLLFLSIPLLVVAADMPPMPPALPGIGSPGSAPKSSNTSDVNLPQSCQMIPPMIYKLPPPLEKLLDSCKNELHMPIESKVLTAFGKEIKNLHVEAQSGFSKVYKISFDKEKENIVKYCNEELSYCFNHTPEQIK